MKTKYLLSALAISAAFVACDKDEQMQVNNTMNTNKNEIVGEELLGSGLSMGLISHEEGQTRATADGKWELGDVAGLGWLVKESPYAPQAPQDEDGVTLAQVDAKLFNNHYYAYQGEGKWNTQGNIYKGWHFAYFPYQYHEEVQALIFTGETLNPAFTMLNAGVGNAYKADIYSNAPHISAAAFLDKSKVNTAAGTITESFNIERVVNVFIPVLKFSDEFKKAALADLAITNIKWNVGTPVFPKTLTINPKALTMNQYLEDGKTVDEDATRKLLISQLYASENPILNIIDENNVYNTYVETNLIDKEGNKNFSLGNTPEVGHYLRMFIPPVNDRVVSEVSLKNYYFEVTVEGGHKFIVDKDDEEFEKLLRLIGTKKDGIFRTISANGKTVNGAEGVVFNLGVKHFVYNNVISAENTWENCVAIADALGLDNPTFKIADGYTLEFDDTEGKMLAPKKGITLIPAGTEATLKIVGKTEWNEKITLGDGVSVQVGDATNAEINERASLTINDASFAEEVLVNYATIEAGKLATIGKKDTENFTNFGTVIIQWGSFVYPGTASDGDVAFRLRKDDGIVTVNTLISSKNLKGSANVNKFIVANRTWDLDEVNSGVSEEEDRYNPVPASAYADLSGVTIVIEGVDAPASVVTENMLSVKNVIMKGANATLMGVDVIGDVHVEGQGKVDIFRAKGVNTDGDAIVRWLGENGFTGVNFTSATNVKGNIYATGNVDIASTEGSILNAIDVKANSVTGSINATGDVVVTSSIKGDVTAKSVTVENGQVYGNVTATNGNVIVNVVDETNEVTITAKGNVTVKSSGVNGSIFADGDVTVAGEILGGGNVEGNNISAAHIVADVVASGNVTVENSIYGNVTAVGNINADYIQGEEVTAEGNVNASDIVATNVTATNVTATTITGNVTVTGNVNVTEKINGDLTWDAEKVVDGETVTVDCPSITGDVTAEGKMTVNATKTNIEGTLTVGNGEKSNGTVFNIGVSKNPIQLAINNIKVNRYSTLNIYDEVTTEKIDNDGTITIKSMALLITGYDGYQATVNAKLNGSVTFKQ